MSITYHTLSRQPYHSKLTHSTVTNRLWPIRSWSVDWPITRPQTWS